ncbi:MAG TPA: DUF3175 domain-containing protein [Rhizomicrobium sp.]|nr:DUF3175 domain-containing protein [Rhizomicrobium sp.]
MAKKQKQKKTRKVRKVSKWSSRVTRESNALDLEQGVFKQHNPRKIAASLKRSAEHSKRRKSSPYPFRHVHAGLLYQPGRQGLAGETEARSGAGQGRTEAAIRKK